MNTEWKIRQEIYHRLHKAHTDDLNTKAVVLTNQTVKHAIDYFNKRDIGWIYPSKSYMVAICYARWLAENFGGIPLEYLSDTDLLYHNDPYFQTYESDPSTYDKILDGINGWNFNETLGMVPDVKQYFNDEFMINDNT